MINKLTNKGAKTIRSEIDFSALNKIRFGTNQRLDLLEKLLSFTESGIPILDALKSLSEEYEKSSGLIKPARLVAINSWISLMDNQGCTFGEAIKGWFTYTEIMLIKSGEDSGDIIKGLSNCIETTKIINETKKGVAMQLFYPSALFLALIAVMVMFAVYIIPVLTEVAPPEQWPSMSQTFYNISMTITNDGLMYATIALSIAALIIASLSRMTGEVRNVLNKLPPYSTYRSFQSYLSLIGISSMMDVGVPIKEAIEKLANGSSPYIKSELIKIIKRIESGMDEATALKTGFYDKETEINISVFSKSQNIARHMKKIGGEAIKIGTKKIVALSSILRLLSTLMIAAYVIFAYYSFYLVTQTMGQGLV